MWWVRQGGCDEWVEGGLDGVRQGGCDVWVEGGLGGVRQGGCDVWVEGGLCEEEGAVGQPS